MDDDLTLMDRSAGAQHGHHIRQHVVGNGQQEELALAGNGAGLVDGDAGQQCRYPVARGV
jgi:hypothetical protein